MQLSDKLDILKARLGRSKTFRKARKLLTRAKLRNAGSKRTVTVKLVGLQTDDAGNVLPTVYSDTPTLVSSSQTGDTTALDTDSLDELLGRSVLTTGDVETALVDLLEQDLRDSTELAITVYDHLPA